MEGTGQPLHPWPTPPEISEWLDRSAAGRAWRAVWAAIGVGLTLIPIVTHGNIGFTQFGYRFAPDFRPLLFVALALVFQRGMGRLAIAAAGRQPLGSTTTVTSGVMPA